MSITKTLVDITDGLSQRACRMDTILWQGRLWLVPKWFPAKNDGSRQPARIIRPQLFVFEQPKAGMVGVDHCLSCAIPKAILDGRVVSEESIVFDIAEAPDIYILPP
jgi:hypothetical protein